MTNPLKNFKQRSAMFRFLFSHQELDDSEHFDTSTFPGDILLMEQWPLLLYSCSEFGMKSGGCTEDRCYGEGAGEELMIRWRCELLYVALQCAQGRRGVCVLNETGAQRDWS